MSAASLESRRPPRHKNIVELMCYNSDSSFGPVCMVMEILECSLHDMLHDPERQKIDGTMVLARRMEIIDDMVRADRDWHVNE